MIKKTKIHIIIFIAVLIIITGMLYQSEVLTSKYFKNSNNKLVAHFVNVVIKKMTLTIHNEQGAHKATLTSSHVTHDPKTNITHLTSPILVIKEIDATWKITSNTGTITHDNVNTSKIKQINLFEQVKILKTNHNNEKIPYVNLETEFLTYTPSTDLITSNQKVTIKTKDSQTTAIGLNFNKATKNLELLSNVKTIHYYQKN